MRYREAGQDPMNELGGKADRLRPGATACPMSRRHFTGWAIGGLASLAMPVANPRAADAAAAVVSDLAYRSGDPTPVSLAGVPRGDHQDAVESAVRAAAQAATDFSWLSRGDIVLIKPVCNSGNRYPATTDPVAIRAMVRLLHERGAGRVVVADMSGVQFLRFGPDHLIGSTRELMGRNRIAAAATAAGADVHAFEEDGWDAFFEEHPAAAGHWSGPLLLPRILQEVDHVILMPRCARHTLAGSTLGLKAAVGWWRHDSRLEYHRDAASFPEKTADANTAPTIVAKQRLVLTSATQVLTTFGPDQGHIATPDTGLVIASESLVAHDMVSLAWLLENRSAMKKSERDGPIDDPFTSGTLSDLFNRVVTGWLGGAGAAMTAQRLQRGDLGTLWGDRVLRRAFENEGGVPRLALGPAGQPVPTAIRQGLEARFTLPT